MKSEKILIEQFIAAKGVRRFERGVSASYPAVQRYLLEKGWDMRPSSTQLALKAIGKPGKGKMMSWAKIIAFTDELRVADGLEPFSTPVKLAA